MTGRSVVTGSGGPRPDATAAALLDPAALGAGPTADRPAVMDAAGSVTYAEVACTVADLAGRIAAVTRPGDAVALSAANDTATLVTLFAILRAGRVAVPIDPREAPDRIGRIVELTSPTRFLRAADPTPGAPDLPWCGVASLPAGDLPALAAIRPDDPALVIFTSGSTGRPKGVVRTQHMLTAVDGDLPGDGTAGRFAFTYPLSFLGAAVCALAIVSVRATACLLDPPAVGVDRLFETLRERRITYCSGTPSMLRAVAERAIRRGETLPAVSLIWIGGEATTVADLELIRRVWPNAVVHNYYGTQESGAVTGWPLRPGDPLPAGVMPAGTPIHGFTVAVTDDDGVAVPLGTPGRICALGPTTATDYLGDPEGAAAVRVTLDGRVGMYTGDLGVIDGQGILHVTGRADRRVKVRGTGVDLLEVEAALRSVPGITDAVVSAVPDPRAGHRLVAHVVAAGRTVPTTTDLRAALSDRLPPAMHPRRVLHYDELPRTARDKIDRNALDALAALEDNPIRPDRSGLTGLGPHRGDRRSVVLVVGPRTPLGPLLALTVGERDVGVDLWATRRPVVRSNRRVRARVDRLPNAGTPVVVDLPDDTAAESAGRAITERLSAASRHAEPSGGGRA